jgi:hypothetical protein
MNKTTFRKNMKQIIDPFLRENKFINNGAHKYYKKVDNIIQWILFSKTTSGINCNISLMPMYYAHGMLSIGFSGRLYDFYDVKKNHRRWWEGETEESMKEELNEIKDLIKTYVLPWLAKIDNPEKLLIKLLKLNTEIDDSVMFCQYETKFRYISYTYLYLKNYTEAMKYLDDTYKIYSEGDRDWEIEIKEEILSFKQLISNNDYKAIEDKLEKNIIKTSELLAEK